MGELTPDELKRMEQRIIIEAQHDTFTPKIKALDSGKELPKKSSILTFTPMVTNGILWSNTRLQYSNDLPDETKYPIILPKKHPVMELIVKYHHETEGHEMGLNYTWIIFARSMWLYMLEKQSRKLSKNVLSVGYDSEENQLHSKWPPYLPYD